MILNVVIDHNNSSARREHPSHFADEEAHFKEVVLHHAWNIRVVELSLLAKVIQQSKERLKGSLFLEHVNRSVKPLSQVSFHVIVTELLAFALILDSRRKECLSE
jgi:hypothetical protein